MSIKEKSCSSPMWFKHSIGIAQQLMPIYNTTVHKKKINVAPNLMWLTIGCLWKHQQATMAVFEISQLLRWYRTFSYLLFHSSYSNFSVLLKLLNYFPCFFDLTLQLCYILACRSSCRWWLRFLVKWKRTWN